MSHDYSRRVSFTLATILYIMPITLAIPILSNHSIALIGHNHTDSFTSARTSLKAFLSPNMITFREYLQSMDWQNFLNSTVFKEIQEIVLDEAKHVTVPAGEVLKVQEIRLAVLRLKFDRILKRLMAHGKSRGIFPRPPGVSSACYEDLMEFVDGLVGVAEDNYASADWALQMLDAYGKPMAGLLMGVLQWVGNYEECLNTQVTLPSDNSGTGPREIAGKYCRVLVPIGHVAKLILPKGVNKFWKGHRNIPQTINWGVCVPKSCSHLDIDIFLTKGTLGSLNLPVANATCFDEPEFKDDAAAVVTVCFLCISVAIVTGCTIVDVYETHRPWFGEDLNMELTRRNQGGNDITELNHCENGGNDVMERNQGGNDVTEVNHCGNGGSDAMERNHCGNIRAAVIELNHCGNITADVVEVNQCGNDRNDVTQMNHSENGTQGMQAGLEESEKEITLAQDNEQIKVAINEYRLESDRHPANGRAYLNTGFVTDEINEQSLSENSHDELPGQRPTYRRSQHGRSSEKDLRESQASAANHRTRNDRNVGQHLIKGLSYYRNLKALLNTERSNTMFECIQGIRVISIAWIMVGHCYTYGGILDETNIVFQNTMELVETSARLSFHIVGSAQLAVDSFFMISGCCVMLFTLKQLEKTKSNPKFWLMFYFHRFWRLTPMYMIVLMVGTNLYAHVVKGPLKADKLEEFYQCHYKWWAHLLYINNFYKPHLKCMTWSWFTAVDMQIYIFSPIFIFSVYRNLKVGVALITCLLVLGITSAFASEYIHGGQFVLMDLSFLEYWSYVYTMPWARVGAFAVGLFLGVALYNHPGHPIMSKQKATCVWLAAFAVGIFLILINHQQWKNNSEHWSSTGQSFYEALVRPAWAFCVAWVVYACCTGLGGCVNSILGWQPFIVLSRLTYSVYLLHPLIIMFVVYSRRTTIYLHPAHLSLAYNYMGTLTLTYLLAVVFSLTFEVPMKELEKIVLR